MPAWQILSYHCDVIDSRAGRWVVVQQYIVISIIDTIDVIFKYVCFILPNTCVIHSSIHSF